MPTPVGPAKRKQPAGRSGMPSPARERLIAVTTLRTASSCPNTTRCSDSSRVRRRSLSEEVACFSGMRAMRATTRSTCSAVTSDSASATASGPSPAGRCIASTAPASSITSMALSGRRTSRRCRLASAAALESASSVYVTLW